MLSLNIKDYVIGIMLIMSIVGVNQYEGIIKDLNKKLKTEKENLSKMGKKRDRLMLSVGVEKANNSTLRNSILEQNLKIEENAIKLKRNKRELDKWKAKAKQDKYKILYDKLKTINMKRGDCNDTKHVINSIGDIDFNELQRMH